jgi:hypothetical protein
MKKQGIMHELRRQGVQAGDGIYFPNGSGLEY